MIYFGDLGGNYMDCPNCNTPMTFEDCGFYKESYLICCECGYKKEVERHSLTNKTRKRGGENKMVSEQKVVEKIEEITTDNEEILNCGLATVDINAPRALMQLTATTKLDMLYMVLQKERPKFKCDDDTKTDT